MNKWTIRKRKFRYYGFLLFVAGVSISVINGFYDYQYEDVIKPLPGILFFFTGLLFLISLFCEWREQKIEKEKEKGV